MKVIVLQPSIKGGRFIAAVEGRGNELTTTGETQGEAVKALLFYHPDKKKSDVEVELFDDKDEFERHCEKQSDVT